MVKDYLISLKQKGKFSWSDLANLSGLPEATIRKVFSGETADPRFETVSRLVIAMGGSLDKINEREKGEETEMNAIIAVKEIYEERIKDNKAAAAEHIASLKKDKRILGVLVGVLTVLLIGVLVLDLLIGSIGWVRY